MPDIPPTALPGTGATDVPTPTSLVVLSGGPPSDLALTSGGVAVPLGSPTLLVFGPGDAVGRAYNFWR